MTFTQNESHTSLMQVNLSTTPPRSQKKVAIVEKWPCREVETRANVWTVRQKKSRCSEVAVSGGSTLSPMYLYNR